MINIAGLTPVDDPSYRYKMPKIQCKIEGRGNGIKTLLCNVRDLASALNREAPEITKFFGTELGAQTTFDGEADRAIVNGAHREPDLQTKLSTYIEKFVLCSGCHLPETHYKIKDGAITQKCLACGGKTVCDMTHKLTTFILAQNKKAKADAKKAEAVGGGDKKEKKEKKDKKDASAKATDAPAAGGSISPQAADANPSKDKKEKKKDKVDRELVKVKSAEGEGLRGDKKKSSKGKKTFFDEDREEQDGGADDDESDAKATG